MCHYTFSVNTPNNFKLITFSIPNTIISNTNNIILSLVISNPLPSSACLKVTSTLLVSFNYTAVSLAKPFLLSSINNITNNLLIANITSTNLNSGSPLILGNFIVVNPPYSGIPINIDFST
jgi:hypothetical protein